MVIIGSEFYVQGYQLIWDIEEFMQGKEEVNRKINDSHFLLVPTRASCMTAPGVYLSLALGT